MPDKEKSINSQNPDALLKVLVMVTGFQVGPTFPIFPTFSYFFDLLLLFPTFSWKYPPIPTFSL